MGEQAWKFTASGVEVEGAPGEFTLAEVPTREELEAAAVAFDSAASGHLSLKRAMISFEGGTALYRDCLQNVLDLQEGLRASLGVLERCYSDLSTFFEAGRTPFSAIRPEGRLDFAGELLKNIHLRVRGREAGAKEAAKAKDKAPEAEA